MHWPSQALGAWLTILIIFFFIRVKVFRKEFGLPFSSIAQASAVMIVFVASGFLFDNTLLYIFVMLPFVVITGAVLRILQFQVSKDLIP